MPSHLKPYVYKSLKDNSGHQESRLSQGDIIRVEGKLRLLIRKHYPSLKMFHNTSLPQWVMVVSQTCDLHRPQKISHLSVVPLVSFEKTILWEYNQKEKKRRVMLDGKESNCFIFESGKYLNEIEKWLKLIKNSDSKNYFFLPQKSPLPSHMVALLHIPLTFRVSHYEEFTKNKCLELLPEFQGKVGGLLSKMFGRIATSDPSEDDENSWREFVKNFSGFFSKLGVLEAPDNDFLNSERDELVNKNFLEVIENYILKKEIDSQNKIKKILKKTLSDILFEQLKNATTLDELRTKNEKELRGFISILLKRL